MNVDLLGALDHIPPDLPRDDWFRVLAALKSELGDSGYEIARNWSAGGDSFKDRDFDATWRSASPDGGIKIATLYHYAKENGWHAEKVAPHNNILILNRNMLRDETDRIRRQQGQDKTQTQTTVAENCAERWKQAVPVTDHPYLARKQCNAHGIKKEGNNLVIPMMDADGKIWSLQTIDPDGTKLFAKGGRAKGLYFRIKGEGPVVICEGYATGASIHEATGYNVAVTFSCGNLETVANTIRAKLPDHRIIIAADSSPTETTAKAREVAQLIGADLAIPSVDSDFNDLFQTEGVDAVKSQISAAINYQDDEWEDPVLLNTAAVQDWPESLLPEPIGDFARAVSEGTETPLEMAMNDILAVLGTAAQRKYSVVVKPGWVEPLSYWGLTVQPPATRKSRVKAYTTAPMNEWEMEQKYELQDAIRDAESQRKTELKIIEGMRSKAVNIKDKQEQQEYIKGITELEANLTEVPVLPRLWTDDITPERLGSLMAENHERMGIFSAEGGVFGIMAGRYSGGTPNLNIYLKSHAGDGERVDRGSRGPIWLSNPALSIGLSVQPEVTHGLTQKREFRGYGVLARFAYAMPRSRLGERTLITKPVNPGLELAYSGRVKAILNREWNTDPATGETVPYGITLSVSAEQHHFSFQRWVEDRMAEGGEFEHMRDWAGKLSGLVARVVALVHIARYATVHPEDHPVSDTDMLLAIEWGRAAASHAIAVFASMGADVALEDARHVWKWIQRRGEYEFSVRDCHNGNQSRFPKSENLESAIRILEDRHYIREKRVEKRTGRPSRKYLVNPKCRI